MYAIFRFDVPVDDASFTQAAAPALDALRASTGCLSVALVRSVEDRAQWVLVAEWEGVGAYRRALGSYDVRLHAHPFLARARSDESAFEVIERR
ncbi:MAG: hypothetical protein QOF57_2740 [Frankiaceae bacterium]|jgi:quinol monooxygenase YgiN|nr:hypothetical protein [Frankiaceae bacterium]MDQ1726561.1 hypothetical protein [Frankiaceae bacterium]